MVAVVGLAGKLSINCNYIFVNFKGIILYISKIFACHVNSLMNIANLRFPSE